MVIITYFDFQKYAFAEIVDASAQDVQRRLDALCEGKEHHFKLRTSFGEMGITAASEGRVLFMFSRQNKLGTLLDPSYPSGSREIEITGDPHGDSRPIRHTVTKEKACEVATYFLENGTVPKGLSWLRNSNDFADSD